MCMFMGTRGQEGEGQSTKVGSVSYLDGCRRVCCSFMVRGGDDMQYTQHKMRSSSQDFNHCACKEILVRRRLQRIVRCLALLGLKMKTDMSFCA